VKGVQVEEIYALDKDMIEALRPVYGLIFLFKYQFEHKDTREPCEAPNVYFAKQVINNACATQAILSVLFNAPEINLGQQLQSFKQETFTFPADVKGTCIGSHEQIRKVHNSFARPEPFTFSGSKKADKDDDVYHFISYVPVEGVLYELDGLKGGPIRLGECNDQNWIEKACESLRHRMETYASNEIRFSLLSIVKNRKQMFQEQIAQLQKKQADLSAQEANKMEEEGKGANAELVSVKKQLREIQDSIDKEDSKFANWKTENIRRKHNYIPFLFHLLKVLAEKDALVPLIEQGKSKQKEREAKEKDAEKGAK